MGPSVLAHTAKDGQQIATTARRRYRHETPIYPRRAGIHHPETTIYIEGAGIAQLRWGGLEIAEGVKDGCLYCKHIKLFSLELYGQYWTAFDGPPERKENA